MAAVRADVIKVKSCMRVSEWVTTPWHYETLPFTRQYAIDMLADRRCTQRAHVRSHTVQQHPARVHRLAGLASRFKRYPRRQPGGTRSRVALSHACARRARAGRVAVAFATCAHPLASRMLTAAFRFAFLVAQAINACERGLVRQVSSQPSQNHPPRGWLQKTRPWCHALCGCHAQVLRARQDCRRCAVPHVGRRCRQAQPRIQLGSMVWCIAGGVHCYCQHVHGLLEAEATVRSRSTAQRPPRQQDGV